MAWSKERFPRRVLQELELPSSVTIISLDRAICRTGTFETEERKILGPPRV